MKSLRIYVGLGLIVLWASAIHAQGVELDPDARRLRLGVDTLAIYIVRGSDTTRTGTLRDELMAVRENGRALLRRVYSSSDRVLGTRVDTLVDVLADLRPVRHRSRSEGAVEMLDFAAGRARGWLRSANQDSAAVDAAAVSAFNASSFDLVLCASSLRANWSAMVPAFVAPVRAVSPLRARVVGVESIDGDACWRVQADFAGTPVTFWIAQVSRALKQQVMQVKPDVQILFRRATPATRAGRAT